MFGVEGTREKRIADVRSLASEAAEAGVSPGTYALLLFADRMDRLYEMLRESRDEDRSRRS